MVIHVSRSVIGLALVVSLPFSAIPLASQVSGGVDADTLRLTLVEAQRLSLQRSPSFLADRQAHDMARGTLRQATAYAFNPQLEFESPGAGTDGGFGRYEASLSQEIEWAGQRGLRIDAADAAVRGAEQSVRDAARLTVAEASAAYFAAFAARRRLVLAEEIFESNERLLAAVRTQVVEGEISALEGSLAEIEVARGRARLLAARREATSAELALKRAIGLMPATAIELAADVPDAPEPIGLQQDSLLVLALQRRPDLAARIAAVTELESTARLARREAIPNLEIRALAERDEAFGERRFGIGVGVPLPLWNRNQGITARLRAETRQAAFRKDATELRIRTEVTDAYQSYLAASEEAAIYERDVLQPAQANQRLLETAYRAGKIDLPALLLLRNQLLDAELSYWDAWLSRRRSLVDLQAATASLGTELREIDGNFEQP